MQKKAFNFFLHLIYYLTNENYENNIDKEKKALYIMNIKKF